MVVFTFYRACRLLVRLLLGVLCRIEVANKSKAVESGPVLICCNHQSILDPPLMAAVMRRRLLFMAAGYLFDIPVLGWILRRLGVLPVQGSTSTLRSMRAAMHHLNEGGAVVIFPQGGVRQPEEELSVQPGAFYMAARAQVPLQPVFIEGTGQVIPGGYYLPRSFGEKISVNFGDVISPENFSREREQLSEMLLSAWRRLKHEMNGQL